MECNEVYKKKEDFSGLDLSILNNGGKRVLETVGEVRISCDLGERMKRLGLTQAELSEITGIRQATISTLLNKRKSTVSIPHMLVLMVALKITRFSDVFDITFDAKSVTKLEKERKEWEETRKIPKDMVNLMVSTMLDKVK